MANDDLFDLVFYVVIIGGAILFELYRRNKARASAHKMNVLFGGSFTPRLERQLTEEELKMLKEKYSSEDIYVDIISPVKKLIGPITFPLNMKPDYQNQQKEKFILSFDVGEEGFNVDVSKKDINDPHSFLSIIDSFDHDELVEVEYTAHSKIVLKIYKYNGDGK
jgi:hypothetical protein